MRHLTATVAASVLVATLASASLAACDGVSTASGPVSGSSASTHATAPTGRAPAASSLWAEATHSLAKRRTVHFHDWFGSDTGSVADDPIIQDFDVTLDGSRQHGTQSHQPTIPTIERLVVGGRTYEKYPDEMLRSLAGHDAAAQEALITKVSGRWVEMGENKPGDGAVRLITHLTDPKHPATKAFTAAGTTVTPTTFAGRSAWKILSGEGRQRAWVAADASHDLLRVESTATTKRDTSETVELSHFDARLDVATPRDIVPFSVLEDAMNAKH